MLVAVALPGDDDEAVDASLDELALLVDTAGADEVARLVQRRDAPDHTWYIGKGKAEELKEICLAVDADTVVFDNELAPAQQFNLEKLLGRTAIDRTAVILDIFGQNAHTMEGKAQVELALLRYRLPRLRRGAKAKLSQQRGGVGGRFGSGETKIEIDRRRIMRRITKLERDLASLAETRALQRQGRQRSGLASVAIVGYTNAGKSTLLNRLTDAGVLSEDRLFATLDPTTRRLALPGGEPVLLTDTVGFVSRLPHGLVESFKGTLEVAALADYLVHVVDAERAGPRGADRLRCARCSARSTPPRCPNCSCSTRPTSRPAWRRNCSPTTRVGRGERRRPARASTGSCARSVIGSGRSPSSTNSSIPYDRGDVLAAVHREGEVVSTADGDDGVDRSGPPVGPVGRADSSEFVTDGERRRVRAMTARPFVPPPYPYDRLNELKAEILERHDSVGRPVDRHPVRPAAGGGGRSAGDEWAERSYPPSVGTAEFHAAVAALAAAPFRRRQSTPADRCDDRFQGVRRRCSRSSWLAHRPTATPCCTRRSPIRATRWERRWPASAPVPVAIGPDGRLDLDSIDRRRRRAGAAAVGQQPGQPDGPPRRPRRRCRAGGVTHDVPVFSDECYVEFTWDGPGRTILEHGHDGVVAVHSLSKRSNFAGARAGFYVGDPDLVDYLREVRKHAGLMVPGPVQAAAVVALDDDAARRGPARALPDAARADG